MSHFSDRQRIQRLTEEITIRVATGYGEAPRDKTVTRTKDVTKSSATTVCTETPRGVVATVLQLTGVPTPLNVDTAQPRPVRLCVKDHRL
jgi:hypothetical protein